MRTADDPVRKWTWGLALILLGAIAPSELSGQGLSGSVQDAVTNAPIPGAVVMLLGSNREPVVRTLTSTAGTFRIRERTGLYLRIIRIGYLPFEAPLAQLDDSATIRMTPLGSRLRPIAVKASAVCPRRRDQREALATWTAATDALSAMLIASTSDADTGEVSQIIFDRLLDTSGRRTIRQSTRRVSTGNVAPIRADRTPEQFARHGYVERMPTGIVYFGPDPAALLDASFAETHCLSLRSDARNHPGEVGVAFAPVRGREAVPDITGVLWLSRQPLALRLLEFEYRGVDQAILDARAGGRIAFEVLSNGVPIISYWHIRSPRLRYLPAGRMVERRPKIEDSVATVGELHENGGLIASGKLSDGTSWTAQLASVAGRVLDPRTGSPVAGASVTLDSTDLVTITDSSGNFAFADILTGPYVVRVLDSVAVPRYRADPGGELVPDTILQQVVKRTTTVDIEARLDRVSTADVRLAWRAPVDGCRGVSERNRLFVVVGQILTQDSLPLGSAALRLRWPDSRNADSETTILTASDRDGQFVVCGVPGSIPIAAEVVAATGRRYEGTLVVPEKVDGDPELSRGTLRPGIKLIARP